MELRLTSGACPERYVLLDDDHTEIGSLQLRHGVFLAKGADGQTVYEADEVASDSTFEGDERTEHMVPALDAVLRANDRFTPGFADRLLTDLDPEAAIRAWCGELD